MSNACRCSIRRGSLFLFAVAGGLLAVSALHAQSRDDDKAILEQTKKRLAIESQRIEAEIRESLLQAQRLAATDAVKALESMKTILARVEDDTTLGDSRRDNLKRMLKDRIRVTEDQSKKTADQADEKADRKAAENGRKAVEDRKALEHERIQAEIKHIRKLQEEGKTEEAGRRADSVAARNPNNPAATAASRISSTADRVAAAKGTRLEKEGRLVGAHLDVERSAMLPRGDIDYPADWAKRTEKRDPLLKLTEKEKSLMKALNTPIPVNFKDTKFEDAIEYLQTISGQTLIIDKQALDEAKVPYDAPVSMQYKAVTMRTVLRKVLQDLGLAYVIKDGNIQITSAIRAKETLTVRAYYIGDLASVTDVRLPLVVNQINSMQAAAQIVESIQGSIDPDSWRVNGGQGTIFLDPRTMTLIVKQNAEVHYMLSGFGK